MMIVARLASRAMDMVGMVAMAVLHMVEGMVDMVGMVEGMVDMAEGMEGMVVTVAKLSKRIVMPSRDKECDSCFIIKTHKLMHIIILHNNLFYCAQFHWWLLHFDAQEMFLGKPDNAKLPFFFKFP